jgi:molecular chaperone GrpE
METQQQAKTINKEVEQDTENNQANSTGIDEIANEAITDDLSSVVAEETQELLKLEHELAELKDNNLRLVAEMQNVQRRSAEEIKKARDYAISNFAREMIAVKDCLEMAIKDQSGNFEMLKMGVDLTLQQLVKVFELHQIKEINPQVKEKLDANLHQAMSVVAEHQQDSNTVVAVLQKGYLLNGRVLRAAMVTVAQ